MCKVQHQLLLILLILISIPSTAFTQDSLQTMETYQIARVFPSLSITKEKLQDAHKLSEINERFDTAWIKAYISVDIFDISDSKRKKASSKNQMITPEQKHMMLNAANNATILVQIKYIPENTLSNNEPKLLEFSFVFDPEKEASYCHGAVQLNQYIDEHIIDKLGDFKLKRYHMAVVTFTIDEDGNTINPKIYVSSENEGIDNILLTSIKNMPKWEAARYKNGQKVQQDFVLMMGDMKSCVINLLNVNKN